MLHPSPPGWRFQCPECGFGDYEVGHLVQPGEVYCIVCLETEDRHVRLQRWEDAGSLQTQARLRGGLAAA